MGTIFSFLSAEIGRRVGLPFFTPSHERETLPSVQRVEAQTATVPICCKVKFQQQEKQVKEEQTLAFTQSPAHAAGVPFQEKQAPLRLPSLE